MTRKDWLPKESNRGPQEKYLRSSLLSYSGQGIAEPRAYCDIDPAAQAVLADRIARRLLPDAPICTDVRQLNPAWLRAHKVRKAPEAIVAGFPCVGFSLVGKRQGYRDEQSGLFREILRIVDEQSNIKYLFLENVGQFLHDGMGLLVKELHTARGFHQAWCIVAASDVGAPQQRRRWFCVAHRGAPPPTPPAFDAGGYAPFTRCWAQEPTHRTACPGGPTQSPLSEEQLRSIRARLRLLGNSVVPDAARHAFLHLLAAAQMPAHERQGEAMQVGAAVSWPMGGFVHGSMVAGMVPPAALLVRPHTIILNPRVYKPSRTYLLLNWLHSGVQIQLKSTPQPCGTW